MASNEKNLSVCPNCGAKLGIMALISEQYLDCRKCKTALEFKYTNMIEKEKIDKFQKVFIPAIAILLAVSVISLIMSVMGNSNIWLVAAQYIVLILVVVYMIILTRMKKNLINLKQLKVVIPGSKSARR